VFPEFEICKWLKNLGHGKNDPKCFVFSRVFLAKFDARNRKITENLETRFF
jgi:hypothetical protein